MVNKGGIESCTSHECENPEKVETTTTSALASKECTPCAGSAETVIDSKEKGFVQSVAKFTQAQTVMMAAQTRVMAANILPPLPHFSGEGNLIGEDSFELLGGRAVAGLTEEESIN